MKISKERGSLKLYISKKTNNINFRTSWRVAEVLSVESIAVETAPMGWLCERPAEEPRSNFGETQLLSNSAGGRSIVYSIIQL